MRFWDNIRTAYTLATRVEECEQQVAEVLFQWGEVQEKMLAREERLRKRLSRELKKELDNPVTASTSEAPIVAPEGSRTTKMAIMNAFREKREG